ncbi:MAG TPA: hypothetical protein VH880_09775 [Anaeromyxobacteraceae bacterium]
MGRPPPREQPHPATSGEAEVRAFGLGCGFVDYKVCAVDATWSGLCFARRASG